MPTSVFMSASASTAAPLSASPTPSNASSAMSRSMSFACDRTCSSASSLATPASAAGSISFDTAARRTRGSVSSRAISVSSSRSSSGISCTKARRTAGSGFLCRDCVRNRSSSAIVRSSLTPRQLVIGFGLGPRTVNPQFLQPRDDRCPVRCRAHLFVDVEQAAVGAYVEGPPRRETRSPTARRRPSPRPSPDRSESDS